MMLCITTTLTATLNAESAQIEPGDKEACQPGADRRDQEAAQILEEKH